ncbi:MAG: hypothetical protein V8Q84_10340 [Bilophila sp.]
MEREGLLAGAILPDVFRDSVERGSLHALARIEQADHGIKDALDSGAQGLIFP